jgi:hypothetical protein
MIGTTIEKVKGRGGSCARHPQDFRRWHAYASYPERRGARMRRAPQLRIFLRRLEHRLLAVLHL